MTVQIEGINLERLLQQAQREGVALRRVRRSAQRCITARVRPEDAKKLEALCKEYGWEMTELQAGVFVGALRFLRRRPALAPAAALCLVLVQLSCGLILRVEVTGAKSHEAQVQRILREEGARAGRLKRSVSTDALAGRLLELLPALSYAGAQFSGSVLQVEVRLAQEGEITEKAGSGMNLVASRPAIVTHFAVQSGTPAVAAGDAVYAGQVLVYGEERDARGATRAVRAQAQVYARVWAEGKARSALFSSLITQTGRERRRVSVMTPWHTHITRDAAPFEMQVTDVRTQRVIDLFVPLIKRTEVFSEISVKNVPRDRAQAISEAQGAAEKLAKKQLPAGALILDKWVDYSMIDNEFVYASVVLEFEQDVAVRDGDVRALQ